MSNTVIYNEKYIYGSCLSGHQVPKTLGIFLSGESAKPCYVVLC